MPNFRALKVEDRDLNQVLRGFRIKKVIFKGLIMPDNCLVALRKSSRLLITPSQLIKFLEP